MPSQPSQPSSSSSSYQPSKEYKYCISDFKKVYGVAERKIQSKNVLAKHPDKIPVIIEKLKNVSNPIPDLAKHKYLMPYDIYMNQLLYIINKRLDISSTESIYLFANDTLISNSESIMTTYQRHKDDDGFLYLYYTAENVFG